MRFVSRSALCAFGVVFALSVVGVASASAHEFYIEGKSMKELGLKEEAVSGKGTSGAKIVFDGVEVGCPTSFGGEIAQGGGGSATFTLSGCSVQKPEGCGVEGSIVLEAGSGLVEHEGKLADEFQLATGEREGVLRLKNNGGPGCPLTGSWPLTGHITGLVSEVEQEAGTLSFTGLSGTELNVGGNHAAFSLRESVKLSGNNAGKKWSAKK